jgi:hypothetical protein
MLYPSVYLLAASPYISSKSILILFGLIYLIAALVFVIWLKSASSTHTKLSNSLHFFILLFLALMIGLLSGFQVDYDDYLRQWRLVTDGLNPWISKTGEGTSNAYGPAYNLLALFAYLHPLLPKCLFIFVWFGTIAWLDKLHMVNENLDFRKKALLWLLIMVNPYFWRQTSLAAHFDILVATCCLGAIHCQKVRREILAGIWLAMGILLKFIPIVLLPFLCIQNRRIRPKLLLTCSALVVLAFTICYILWGDAVFHPLLYAGERPSARHSIFRFLRGEYSPLRLFTDNPNVDFMSFPLIVLLGGILFLLHLKHNFEISAISLLTLTGVLLLYKVGHSQFQIIPIYVGSYWFIVHGRPGNDIVKVGKLALFYLAWISILAPALELAMGSKIAHEVKGILTFSVGSCFWLYLLKDSISRARSHFD